MMVMPSGRRSSDPTPWPKASGVAPSIAAIVVMRIGRNRSRLASRMASKALLCSLRCASSAKSIIMIAFFCTIPINRTIPMMATTVSSSAQMSSAKSAPTLADGSVDRMVTGWI